MMLNLWKWRSQQHLHRCILLGLDTTGKTTLLFNWHLGEVFSTIPTIGFNWHAVTHSGRTIDVIDFGGCDRMAPLARHYIDATTGILFMYPLDAGAAWTQESLRLLKMHIEQLLDAGGKYMWVMVTRQDLVPVEEQDVKRAEVYQLLKEVLTRYEPHIVWKVFDERGLNAFELSRLWPIFDEIAQKLNEQNAPSRPLSKQKVFNQAELKEKINREAYEDEPVEKFWQEFLAADLPRWDHRNHLRAAYLILLKSAALLDDFWAAVDIFFEHINRLRRSRPDRFRNTAHRTMTTFWMHAVQLAIFHFRDDYGRLPSEEEFQEVILRHPQLADTGYWENFYDRSVMLTPLAKQNWCLPDKNPLPISFTTWSDASGGNLNSIKSSMSSRGLVVQPKGMDSEDQVRLISFALAVVQEYLNTGKRRGKVIATSLAKFQKTIMQQRASHASNPVPPYSETQSYFWIQIVHATLLPLYQQRQHQLNHSGLTSTDQYPQAAGRELNLTFTQFTHIFNIKPDLWTQFYSFKLWHSISARISFVNPDLYALPNVFPTPSSSLLAERFLETKTGSRSTWNSMTSGIPIDQRRTSFILDHTFEEIEMRIDSTIAVIEEDFTRYNNGPISATHAKDVKKIRTENFTGSTVVADHFRLLLKLYVSLERNIDPMSGKVNVPRFISRMLSHGIGKEFAGGMIDANSIDNETAQMFSRDIRDITLDVENKEALSSPDVTKALFYAHMVLVFSSGSKGGREPQSSELGHDGKCCSVDGFRSFLLLRPQLLWDDFPMQFYLPETWHSMDAKTTFVPPDLKPLPDYRQIVIS